MSGNGNLAGHRIIVKQYSLHYQCHTEEETPLHHTGQCSGCQILTWKHCNKYFLVHYEKLCVAYPKSETNSTLIDLSWKRNHISVNTYMFTYLSIMNDSLGRCSGRSVSQVDRKSSLKIFFKYIQALQNVKNWIMNKFTLFNCCWSNPHSRNIVSAHSSSNGRSWQKILLSNCTSLLWGRNS